MSEPGRAAVKSAAHAWARGRSFQLEPMPGGASTREFFRLSRSDGTRGVAMFVPDATSSDEISKTETRGRWPFLEVRELLEARGVRVPHLLHESCDTGVIVVEDLGDVTLAAAIEAHPDARATIYGAAVRDLARAQGALARLPDESVITTRAFDFDLLRWELDHFREFGLDARGLSLGVDRARFDAIADELARRIAALPRGFVHRDYQSRNLMVLGEPAEPELVWIDFQDALLGPRAYDLVALLNDSYQDLDLPFMRARLDEFATEADLDAGGRSALEQELHLITVQRKLKDAGRFVFIEHKKGDASYLPYIEPTLDKVFRALDVLGPAEPFGELRAILARALGR